MAASLPPSGTPNVLYVFDLSAWVHRYWATIRYKAAHGFVSFMARVIRDRAPSHMVVCADLNVPTFRHKLAPHLYKTQRAEKDPALVARIRWAGEMATDVWGVPVLSRAGFEADDVIASVVKHARKADMKVVLVALDKDLMQLIDGENVVMWNGKDKVWGIEEVVEKFSVTPSQLGDYLALVGDKADNIPGVPGIGPRAAVDILTACGTLDNSLAMADRKRGERGIFDVHIGYAGILKKRHEEAKLCQKLTALADDALETLNLEALRLRP